MSGPDFVKECSLLLSFTAGKRISAAGNGISAAGNRISAAGNRISAAGKRISAVAGHQISAAVVGKLSDRVYLSGAVGGSTVESTSSGRVGVAFGF